MKYICMRDKKRCKLFSMISKAFRNELFRYLFHQTKYREEVSGQFMRERSKNEDYQNKHLHYSYEWRLAKPQPIFVTNQVVKDVQRKNLLDKLHV